MRIITVNQYIGPEQYCPAFRPTHLARQWVKEGHEVTIVGASFSHLFQRTPARPTPRVVHLAEGHVRYAMLRTPPYRGNGLSRAFGMVQFVARLASISRWVRTTVRPNVVIAGSVHGLDMIPCRAWARQCRATLVRDVRDLWPLTLTIVSGIAPHHPLVRLLAWGERYGYRVADRVITTLPGSLPHMEPLGLAKDRWRFVPHGVDLEQWDAAASPLPEAHRGLTERLQREGRLIVGFTGSHGHTNALDVLLEAAKLLTDKPVAFVLVGQGREKERLQHQATAMGLSNTTFLPSVPRSAMRSLLEAVDVAYIGWRDSRLYEFGISPNKLMDYTLAAKPVIHSVGKTNDLVADCGCGRSVPPEDPKAVADAVEWMLAIGPEERRRLGRLGRDHVVQHYPYPVVARQYLDALA